jgi:hypothetical protein
LISLLSFKMLLGGKGEHKNEGGEFRKKLCRRRGEFDGKSRFLRLRCARCRNDKGKNRDFAELRVKPLTAEIAEKGGRGRRGFDPPWVLAGRRLLAAALIHEFSGLSSAEQIFAARSRSAALTCSEAQPTINFYPPEDPVLS